MKSYDRKIKQLIKLYIRAEKRLINIISTKTVKGQVTDFYESLLKQVKLELMKLQVKTSKLSKDIVKELYLEAYEKSLELLEIANIKDGFTSLHTDAINILTENLVNNFSEVNNQVGRKIEDTIRDIGLTNAQLKFATGQTIKQLQKELRESLVNEGIGGITDKRGRVIPFTVYAELLARSIVAETQNTSVVNVAKEYKHDLVKMTEHKTACPVCQKYEGKIYSVSGEDKRYPYLKSIPGFNKGYNNIHPRCRHRISVFVEKYNQNINNYKNNTYDELVVSLDEEGFKDEITYKFKELGIKGKVNIPPQSIDISNYVFDDNHINKERYHNINKEEAISFIESAIISLERWNGQSIIYYSWNGATYIDTKSKTIRTSFGKNQYDEKTIKMMEVLKEYGY